MRVLISGGGTGGHVNPAIAIANYLCDKNKNIQIAFAGTEKGIENKLVPKAGYKIYYLKVRGFNRKKKISFANIDAAVKAFTSRVAAKKIIKNYNPDVVVGTGGYVSWPVLSVAAKLKIPTVILEENAFPGVTTKALAKTADKVMISFEESRKYFKDGMSDKYIYTGTPVKSEFFNVNHKDEKKELSPGRPMIISVGGSGGAEKINEVLIDFMDKYSKNKNITHYHVTGPRGFKEYGNLFRSKGLGVYSNLYLNEYIYDIHKYYAAADIIICRSGAATLNELAVVKKTAILIPSPNVAENHQYKNAEVLEKHNAAVIIEEKDLTAESLIKKVEELTSDPFKLPNMGRNISRFASYDTLDKIYEIIMGLKK
ncbi:MAG: undecaprenyldiphospho-muramoylpentapeptide beta-N-acetylglucosaminyltransferase [Oscillospiraceae bacterium]|nr:undecaprenyldiphospho-muramoylpentapeptide beta-N-acetylglucosaminyltransferase [Oscillospiraceae bacterium]